jgi:hypothetical protein
MEELNDRSRRGTRGKSVKNQKKKNSSDKDDKDFDGNKGDERTNKKRKSGRDEKSASNSKKSAPAIAGSPVTTTTAVQLVGNVVSMAAAGAAMFVALRGDRRRNELENRQEQNLRRMHAESEAIQDAMQENFQSWKQNACSDSLIDSVRQMQESMELLQRHQQEAERRNRQELMNLQCRLQDMETAQTYHQEQLQTQIAAAQTHHQEQLQTQIAAAQAASLASRLVPSTTTTAAASTIPPESDKKTRDTPPVVETFHNNRGDHVHGRRARTWMNDNDHREADGEDMENQSELEQDEQGSTNSFTAALPTPTDQPVHKSKVKGVPLDDDYSLHANTASRTGRREPLYERSDSSGFVPVNFEGSPQYATYEHSPHDLAQHPRYPRQEQEEEQEEEGDIFESSRYGDGEEVLNVEDLLHNLGNLHDLGDFVMPYIQQIQMHTMSRSSPTAAAHSSVQFEELPE